jgi:FkbM family methyltransferase
MPKNGNVVFDCGACVGEMSTIFAALVGDTGQVHTFDPIPLHTKFIKYHARINPKLSNVFFINELAIDSMCKKNILESGSDDTTNISPGGLMIDNFDSITIDQYVLDKSINQLDYIKMDIEGYELNALKGSKNTIIKFKPKLAICLYHKPDDLWNIINLLKTYNPNYSFMFGHHSPVDYEAVLYAY